MLPSFTHVRPTTLAEAIRFAAVPGARLHAGGTDLLGCLRDGVFDAATVVSLQGLNELRGIARTPAGAVHIGALTTLAEVGASPLLAGPHRALADAARAAASPQLRHQGTLGGNLCQRPRCWYFRGDFHCARKGGDSCYAVGGENQLHAIFGGEGCVMVHPSDTAPALVALAAEAHLVGPDGRRVVPLAEFFVGPAVDVTRETVLAAGEVLTAVVLPPARAAARSAYHKARARETWDFALAGVALAVEVSERTVTSARVVLAGVAPVPWRVTAAEAALVGREIGPAAAVATAAAAAAGAEPLGENAYKVALVRGVVETAVLALA